MYVTYTRSMTENALPLPYEVQEMTTTEARKRLPDLVNMAAFGHVTTVLVRDGRRLARIVPEEDAWVYSPAWQDKLREAEADISAGRVRRFDTDDDFLTHLDDLDDQAGGGDTGPQPALIAPPPNSPRVLPGCSGNLVPVTLTQRSLP